MQSRRPIPTDYDNNSGNNGNNTSRFHYLHSHRPRVSLSSRMRRLKFIHLICADNLKLSSKGNMSYEFN